MWNNFDGLRLIAALTVLWGHQYLLLGLLEPRIAHVRSPMHLAVLVFFSMSGYLVASSWQSDPHAGRFMLRRLLRIWPGWATCVVILGVGALIAARDAMDTLAAQFWFTNLFFYGFDWEFFKSTHRHALNGSLWTIPFEVQCYVLLAAVGLAAGRLIKWAAVGAFVALLSVFVALGGERAIVEGLRNWGSFPHLPYFGAFFVAGSLLFYFAALQRYLVAFLVLGACAYTVGQSELATLLVIPISSVMIGLRSWPVLRSASRFGDLSYGIYLWAWPMQQLVIVAMGKMAPFPTVLACSLASTVACAWLSWHLVERPALRLKPAKSEAWMPNRGHSLAGGLPISSPGSLDSPTGT